MLDTSLKLRAELKTFLDDLVFHSFKISIPVGENKSAK